MFGYATDETEQLMPLTHVLATQLGYKLTEVILLSCILQSGSRLVILDFLDAFVTVRAVKKFIITAQSYTSAGQEERHCALAEAGRQDPGDGRI